MKRVVTIVLMTSIIFSCFLLQGCGDINDFLPNKTLSAEEIYEIVSPSVVEIKGKTRTGTVTGTGFFCDEKGTVITNYHVIEGCISASITLSNGRNYRVDKVLGCSEEKDIAILSTKCELSIPLTIRTTPVKTGESVYAMGSSLGFLSGSFSNGIISSAGREVNGHTFIQTTAPISNGNSGGPLVDSEGKVVGIMTGSFDDGQNLNLAIPIAAVNIISTESPMTLNDLFPQWKIVVIAVNSSEFDEATYKDSISKYDPVYFHFKLSGGGPGETVRITARSVLPNGMVEEYIFEDEWGDGDILWYGWTEGIYEYPEYGAVGTLHCDFYDDEGNLIGVASVDITE